MITHLIGKLCDKKPPFLVIEVGGIGYEIQAPMGTFYQLPPIGQIITLLIHYVVREDAHLLFGFYQEEERKLFRALIKVNGIGPKLALTILSGIEIQEFVHCIHAQDDMRLTRIPGVGKKTAERMVIEMRDALSQWNVFPLSTALSTPSHDPNQAMMDAISALTALGYKPAEAKQAISKVHQPQHTNEQLIRLALQHMAIR